MEEENVNGQQDMDLLAHLDECEESCQNSVMHCLDEGGDFVEKDHIRWLLDCADICHVSKNFLIRDSEYAGDLLSICACLCEDCAQSCREFFNDKTMSNCALVCENCAAACRDAITDEEIKESEAEETEESRGSENKTDEEK